MINFNEGKEILNKYLGSEKKTTLIYNGELYMLKFPDPIRAKNNPLSYMNNQYSEHIGSNIFKACGFNAQETTLGIYTDKKGTQKVVVGCKDFTQEGAELYEFSKIGNSIYEIDEKMKLSIESVQLIIASSDLIRNKIEIMNKFWDMFVVDALLGNADRHFDNWGLLEKDGEITFAPIYDCGSSLGAMLDDDSMRELLSDPVGFKNREYNVYSCYSMDDKRIFYHEMFRNPTRELRDAIKRIVPEINMDKIHKIVSSAEGMTETRKEYLTKALDIRYEQILAPSLKRIVQ